MARQTRTKVKIGISLDADLYAWLQSHTGVGNEFSSISHAIERTVARYQAEVRERQRSEGQRTASGAREEGSGSGATS